MREKGNMKTGPKHCTTQQDRTVDEAFCCTVPYGPWSLDVVVKGVLDQDGCTLGTLVEFYGRAHEKITDVDFKLF